MHTISSGKHGIASSIVRCVEQLAYSMSFLLVFFFIFSFSKYTHSIHIRFEDLNSALSRSRSLARSRLYFISRLSIHLQTSIDLRATTFVETSCCSSLINEEMSQQSGDLWPVEILNRCFYNFRKSRILIANNCIGIFLLALAYWIGCDSRILALCECECVYAKARAFFSLFLFVIFFTLWKSMFN